MLNTATINKLSKNYINYNLEKSANNIDKKIEALKDEKAISLILKAMQEIVSFLERQDEQPVHFSLCSNTLSFPNLCQRLEIEVNIGGESYSAFLEELDSNAVCFNYLSKNKANKLRNVELIGVPEATFIQGKFKNNGRDSNFMKLGNVLLGEELTLELLESILDSHYQQYQFD